MKWVTGSSVRAITSSRRPVERGTRATTGRTPCACSMGLSKTRRVTLRPGTRWGRSRSSCPKSVPLKWHSRWTQRALLGLLLVPCNDSFLLRRSYPQHIPIGPDLDGDVLAAAGDFVYLVILVLVAIGVLALGGVDGRVDRVEHGLGQIIDGELFAFGEDAS